MVSTLNIADRAIASLKENSLPATPTNYEIWYNYHVGIDPKLSRAIDILVSNNRAIDDAVMQELHGRYVEDDQEAEMVRTSSERLEQVVASVMSEVESASKNAGDFGSTLEGFSSDLEGGGGDIKTMVLDIIAETRHIEEQNQRLQDELTSYSTEIVQLREDLESVREEARTDALTGLANRKFLDNFLRDAARQAIEESEDLTVMLTDIDHFKGFNDTYGHQIGDQVLKVVAGILKDNTKGRDLAARYGGEEFCVILPSTNLGAAAIVGEQIRAKVAAKKIVKKRTGEELRQVTISIGVAKFFIGEPVADTLARADKALYLAKEKGRNLVVLENELADERAAAQ